MRLNSSCAFAAAFRFRSCVARIGYAGRLLANYFFRWLIFAQTFEGSLADQVVRGPGAEGNLRDELRLYPVSAATFGAIDGYERVRIGANGFQALTYLYL